MQKTLRMLYICKKQYNEAVAQLKADLEEVFKLESYNAF